MDITVVLEMKEDALAFHFDILLQIQIWLCLVQDILGNVFVSW
jgi:hypothetical protein